MQATELPLRDIQIPPAISWWPPAIGWWVLALLMPLSLYLGYRLYKHKTRKTVLKSAKKQFALLKQNQSLNKREELVALSSLIRRTAISLYPRTDVASLTGDNWLNFLDNSSANCGFNSDIGCLLTHAIYSPTVDTQYLGVLFDLCETWLNAQQELKT